MHVVRLTRRYPVKQPERVLIAAVADYGDSGDLVGVARFWVSENDGCVRLVHRLFHARVLFRGERLVQGRERGGVARFEHRLRGVVALVRVRRHQREAAKGGIDYAAQPVIDDDGIDVVGRRGGERLAGGGVEQLAVFGLDVNFLLRGAEHQPRVFGRREHLRGQGIAAGDNLVDCLAGIAQRAFGESGQRVHVRIGVGHRRGGEDKTEGAYERHHAIVEATHCIQFPAL